jgi:hypothetical protein
MSYDLYVADRRRVARSRSDFVGKLNEAIRQNPVPAALVGAGILWLFMGGRYTVLGGASRSVARGLGHGAQQAGGAAYQGARDVGERVSAGVSTMAERAAEAGSQVGSAARSATGAIGETAKQAAETVMNATSNAADHISSRAGRSQRSTGSSMDYPDVGRRVQDTLSDLFARQPLLLGAVGLAIGAGIAASMPASETEDRVMGDTADTVKDRAGELWRETKQRAVDTASRGMEEARKQGLAPEAAGNAARNIASKVMGVADKASSDIVGRIKV